MFANTLTHFLHLNYSSFNILKNGKCLCVSVDVGASVYVCACVVALQHIKNTSHNTQNSI